MQDSPINVKCFVDNSGNVNLIRTGKTYSINTQIKNGTAQITPNFYDQNIENVINELTYDIVMADAERENLKKTTQERETEIRNLNAAINLMISQGFISYENATQIFNEVSGNSNSDKNQERSK